jgi:cytochrome c-type biogenesis protein CcmH/NrfG
MTDELLLVGALLVAVYVLTGVWRRYSRRSRTRRRQVLDRWQAQPPNEHTSTEENGTP